MPPTLSHLTQDGASSKYERSKRQHYARVNTPAAIPPRSIIPFVIEATGRLGPSALLFLQSKCGSRTVPRSNFLTEINLICDRTAGRMYKMTRDRFQGLPRRGPGGQEYPFGGVLGTDLVYHFYFAELLRC